MTKAAQATTTNETPPEAAAKAAPSLSLGKGFRRLRVPHYHVEVGNEILGKVIAKHKDVQSKKFKNQKQDMVDVVLAKPCKIRSGTNKQTKAPIVTQGESGSTVRFQVRAGMGQLYDMVKVGDTLNMVCTGQVETDKGNPAWTFDVAYQPVDPDALDDEDGVDV